MWRLVKQPNLFCYSYTPVSNKEFFKNSCRYMLYSQHALETVVISVLPVLVEQLSEWKTPCMCIVPVVKYRTRLSIFLPITLPFMKSVMTNTCLYLPSPMDSRKYYYLILKCICLSTVIPCTIILYQYVHALLACLTCLTFHHYNLKSFTFVFFHEKSN